MGSYENIVKIEEMRRKVDEGDLLSAQKVLDTMELRKIKNITDLSLIAEVYTGNERYEEAAELYLKINDKVKSRKSLFQLIDIMIKLNNAEEAQEYLKQYQKIAPKDFYNYIFQYKIDKMKGESFEHLIGIMEELKQTEYMEKWAYELAKLYYKAGMEKECIKECTDIELWFGEGTYVEKAKILKSYYSGETDKDTIMEKIKLRAEVINFRKDDDGQLQEAEVSQYDEDSQNDEASQYDEVSQYAEGNQYAEGSQYSEAGEYDEDSQYKESGQYEESGQYTVTEADSEQEAASAYSQDSYDYEDDTYAQTDFMAQEDTKEFIDSLKKDIQDILNHEKKYGYVNES
ncbi:MAG TPA: hypothetical protein VN258_15430, partial [Mobilitalea sp.]|nr:hypothetical protein [Mobilitalea sp.]